MNYILENNKDNYMSIDDIDRLEIILGVKWSKFRKKTILLNVNWNKSKDINFDAINYLKDEAKNFPLNNFIFKK